MQRCSVLSLVCNSNAVAHTCHQPLISTITGTQRYWARASAPRLPLRCRSDAALMPLERDALKAGVRDRVCLASHGQVTIRARANAVRGQVA